MANKNLSEFVKIAPLLDEDDMASDSAAHGATQQSIVAYVGKKQSATVQTLDDTQTTLDSITLLDENVYHVKAMVVGVKADGSQRASYEIDCAVYRTGAGNATLQGAVTTLHSAESDAAWDVTFSVNGNDLRVSVTGVAGTTIEWGSLMSYLHISN